MSHAHSRLTAQGQVSVPAAVRRKLGVGPGAVLEWVDSRAGVVVRRVGEHTSEELHRALFKQAPRRRSDGALREGIRRHVRRRHARR